MGNRILWLGGILWCLSLACSSSKSPTPDGGTTLAPTPLAEQLFTDGSGQLLAEAYREHVPTPGEIKTVAAFWTYVLEAQITGAFDENFLNSNLPSEVSQIALEYPDFFTADPDGGVSVVLQAVINSPADFSCSGNCLPSSSLLTELPDSIIGAIAAPTGTELIEIVNNAYETLLGAVNTLTAAGVPVPAAVDEAISQGEEETATAALAQIGAALSTVGVIAEAAGLTGVSAATAEVAATVGAALVEVLGEAELSYAASLAVSCEVWKLAECCGSPPVQCSSDQSCCSSVCTDEHSDPMHCGGCGTVCPTAQSCCFSSCTDEQNDALNCGSCGNACTDQGPDLTCVGGVCSACAPSSCYSASASAQFGLCFFWFEYPNTSSSTADPTCTAGLKEPWTVQAQCPENALLGGCCFTSPDAGTCPDAPTQATGTCYYDSTDDPNPFSEYVMGIEEACAQQPGSTYSMIPPSN